MDCTESAVLPSVALVNREPHVTNLLVIAMRGALKITLGTCVQKVRIVFVLEMRDLYVEQI